VTTSSATATWEGGLRGGKGQFAGKSGLIQGSYSFPTRGQVPGIDQAAFARAAEGAKEGCPVSQALIGNVPFELDARLA
jgi:organic hydroperoxide reductase OsmC/OhrA